MKKYSLFLFFFILMFCCSCSASVEYPSYFKENSIESIQIVKAKSYINNEEFYHNVDLEYEVVKEIHEMETFMQEVVSLDFYTMYNPPSPVPSGYYSIKVNYANNVYELFDCWGYVLYNLQASEEISRFIYCDSEDYYKLVEKWIGCVIDTKNIYEVRGEYNLFYRN